MIHPLPEPPTTHVQPHPTDPGSSQPETGSGCPGHGAASPAASPWSCCREAPASRQRFPLPKRESRVDKTKPWLEITRGGPLFPSPALHHLALVPQCLCASLSSQKQDIGERCFLHDGFMEACVCVAPILLKPSLLQVPCGKQPPESWGPVLTGCPPAPLWGEHGPSAPRISVGRAGAWRRRCPRCTAASSASGTGRRWV